MSNRRVAPIVLIVFMVASVIVVRADQPQTSLSPDRILKGTTPIITITRDQNVPEQDAIKSVQIGGQPGELQKSCADGKLCVQVPKLDIVGSADVQVIGKDDKSVSVGQLIYVEPSSGALLGSGTALFLLSVYVGLIVLLPLWATMYDIKKSYEERCKVFGTLPKDKSTIEQIRDLLKDMDQGPTGLVGLTRGIVALTLILLLAIAAFHLIVFTPKVPDLAEKLIMLLAGTLTAITGFYFGSKASTDAVAAGAAATATQTQASAGKSQGPPKVTNVNPPSGAPPNASVTLVGQGFGELSGKASVQVDAKNVTPTAADWKDTQIAIKLPADVQPGTTVKIVVTNSNGDASDAVQYPIIKVAGPPKISNVNPPSGAPPNASVTLVGQGFGELSGKASVQVDAKNVTPTAADWKDTQIAVKLPADAQPGQVKIVVTNSNGDVSDPHPYTIT